MIITREYLISLLDAWKINKITTVDIFETIEEIFPFNNLKFLDLEDGKSATHEVLAYLDLLDIDLITQEDIEPCKEFLLTPVGFFDEGYRKWLEYQSSINHADRVKKLKGQAPYII